VSIASVERLVEQRPNSDILQHKKNASKENLRPKRLCNNRKLYYRLQHFKIAEIPDPSNPEQPFKSNNFNSEFLPIASQIPWLRLQRDISSLISFVELRMIAAKPEDKIIKGH